MRIVGVDTGLETESRHRSEKQTDALRVSLVILGALAFLLRGLFRLVHARLQSEDGVVFLAGQWNDGLNAFWHPYGGYLLLGPRLIAFLTSPLPLTAVPLAYVGVAAVIYLLVVAQVLTYRIGWLLPTKSARAATFVLMCLLAPMNEVYGNLANLVAVAGVGLFLASMCGDPVSRTGRVGELVLCGIGTLTGPYGLLLLPLFWYRWHREGRSAHSFRLALGVSALAGIQGAVLLVAPRPMSGHDSLQALARALVERLAGAWLYDAQPVFTDGQRLVPFLVAGVWLICACGILLVALRGAGLMFVTTVVVLMAAAVHAYGDFLEHPLNAQRQLVVPTAMLVLGLCAAVARAPSRIVTAGAVVALAGGAPALLNSLAIPRYPQGSDMAQLQRCVDSGRPSCSIPIYGPGWVLTLETEPDHDPVERGSSGMPARYHGVNQQPPRSPLNDAPAAIAPAGAPSGANAARRRAPG